MESLETKSISNQKIKAYVAELQTNENFWNALLVFIGALALLSAIPFYPIYIIPILAICCGILAYSYPPAGVILGVFLALPMFAYQSYSLGFLFMLIAAIIFFEVFDYWNLIAALEALIFLPFAFFPLSLLGGFVMLGMVICALNAGSSKAILVSIPSVFLILFLSTIWVYSNSGYMPLNIALYEPKLDYLQLSRPAVPLFALPNEIILALSSILDFSKASEFSIVLGKCGENITKMLLSDSGLIQLVVWSIVLYLISFSSGRIKGKQPQFFSSLFLLVIPIEYFVLSIMFGYAFRFEVVFYTLASIGIIGFLETKNIVFSQEGTIIKKQKLKEFGKLGVRDLSLEGSEKFEDVGGYEDVKEEIKDAIIVPLEQKELAYTYGLKPSKGILLFGPPGCGKTMLIRALANEISYRLYYVNTSELLSKWYGESEKNISDLFAEARKNAPCILMFDEIDSIGKSRLSSTDDVTPRVLSVLLQEIDGAVSSKKPIIVIGTTNVPHQLDYALLRPGRFDKIIYLHLPDADARKAIFKVHLSKYPTKDIDYEQLAKKTVRFSGADIKNIVNEAVMIVAKQASKKDVVTPISNSELLEVIEKTKPSVSLGLIEEYEKFKLDFERRISGEKLEKREETETRIKWQDVVGLGKVKEALLDAIQLPLLHEELMKEYAIKPSKGILLFGPPGCGKTMIIKAASHELKASFSVLSGADLMKRGYSQAAQVLKEAFLRAKENTPSILFIDEIETVAPARTFGDGNIIGQLLGEMDGIKELKGVVVIGATNKPFALDAAILRPGRFDKIFYIPPPDLEGRKEIFRINLGKFAEGIDLNSIAQKTDGFSGADISSIVQRAKMSALRNEIEGKTVKITTQALLDIISSRKPSITNSIIEEYKTFLEEYGERR